MKFQDKFYDIIDYNKYPSSEKSAEKFILRKSYFHHSEPKYNFNTGFKIKDKLFLSHPPQSPTQCHNRGGGHNSDDNCLVLHNSPLLLSFPFHADCHNNKNASPPENLCFPLPLNLFSSYPFHFLACHIDCHNKNVPPHKNSCFPLPLTQPLLVKTLRSCHGSFAHIRTVLVLGGA